MCPFPIARHPKQGKHKHIKQNQLEMQRRQTLIRTEQLEQLEQTFKEKQLKIDSLEIQVKKNIYNK
jgi:hypothetical protein